MLKVRINEIAGLEWNIYSLYNRIESSMSGNLIALFNYHSLTRRKTSPPTTPTHMSCQVPLWPHLHPIWMLEAEHWSRETPTLLTPSATTECLMKSMLVFLLTTLP